MYPAKSLRTMRRAARRRSQTMYIEPMENRMLLSAPTLTAISDVTVNHSSPLIVGLNGADTDNDNLTWTVNVTGTAASHLTATVLGDNDGVNYNRSLVLETSMGTMVFELFEDLVPDATARIIEMVEAGYYDNMTFHRVINDFVIQTGSYEYSSGYVATNNGTYTTFDDQYHLDLQHNSTGLLSWAKLPYDDSASTDFFITDYNAANNTSVNNLRNLDYNYSIFGKIVEGADVLAAITTVSTGTHNGLQNSPNTPVIITDARIETNEQNATLMLKVGDNYNAGEQVVVTVTADDGNGGTVSREFTVTLQTDNDDLNATISQASYGADYSYSEYVANSDPYIATMNAVVVPYGTNTFNITGSTFDVDGLKDVDFSEYLVSGQAAYTGTSTEKMQMAILDGNSLGFSTDSSNVWDDFVDLSKYTIQQLQQLPTGLTFTGDLTSSSRISATSFASDGTYLNFQVPMTRTDGTLVGVYHFLIARYNVTPSPNDVIGQDGQGNNVYRSYRTTEYDTQIVTMILQPPTPTALTINGLNSGYTNDTTPSITVTGLTVGATLKIYDQNDNVVATLNNVASSAVTLDITTPLTTNGQYTLYAKQTVYGAESEAASATVTIDTVAPSAFTDFALTGATSGTVYTYDVGHPQEDDSTISFYLTGAPTGMVIDPDTAQITWTTPSDSNYPSVTFTLIARDLAGNQTTQQVSVSVSSVVDISGVVFLDANTNGTMDANEGQGGVTVYADLNGNNILDETDIATITSTTGSVGSYTLENVPAGSVILHQVMVDGFQQVTPASAELTLVQTITQGDAATINNSATTVEGLAWAGAVAMSPDGLTVYASGGPGNSSSADGIAVFSRNPNDGTLTYIQFIDGITALVDPNAILVAPDGRHVYVTCQNGSGDGIIILARDTDTGLLTHVSSITDGGTDADSNAVNNIAGTVGLAASSDGEFIYVASRNDDSVSVFARNRNTGKLTLVQEMIDGTTLNLARFLALSPDGASLYVGGGEGIVVYSVNTTTGLLSHVQDVAAATLSDMREIAITPDGQYLYAASDDDATLNVFQRNTSTGELTLQSTDNSYGAPSGVKINSDGTKLYMTTLYVDQIHVFDIESNGSLTFVQTLSRNGTDPIGQTISKMDSPVTLILDPDGHDVYVVSRASQTLEVYSDRTRSFAGTPILLEVTPTSNNHTSNNFLNEQVTNNVVTNSDRYNTLQFDADRPANRSSNAPIDWQSQRSIVRDVSVSFEHDLLTVDKTAVSLVRIFDVDGNATTDTITLDVNDVIVDGNTLTLRNLDLADDGVYELTIGTGFNDGMTDEYSTYFHQLFGDMNGDRAFNIADMSAMIYWRQLSSDVQNHVYVPAYLDVMNTSDAAASDGRVDTHDFAAFVSSFGSFIPQDAVPIPDIVLLASSQEPVTAGQMLAYASNPPKTASLKLVWADDEDDASDSTLLDQLDSPNLVLELLETE